ncbi:hypothetical protein BBJ28_00023739, partial [Nothophytophthora sp. Chile5]
EKTESDHAAGVDNNDDDKGMPIQQWNFRFITQPSLTSVFIWEQRNLVVSGDYGPKKYMIHRIYKKLQESKDRYIFDGFDWTKAISSDAPALLFRNACDDVAGFRGSAKLPTDIHHLEVGLQSNNILQHIKYGVHAEWGQGRVSPPNQYTCKPTGYYSKLKFKKEEACAFPAEYWMQAGNRESAVHVDHGRVVAYIPPCAKQCFKV